MVLRPILLLWILSVGVAAAQSVQMAALNPQSARLIRDVVVAAESRFTKLPKVRLTSDLGRACNGPSANRMIQYCTDQNVIFVAADLADVVSSAEAAAYMVAHVYGHAVQVRHGQATIALRAIRAEPAREGALRGMVTRQVECIAGVIYGQVMPKTALSALFAAEPFTGSHWGRTPLSGGPAVSIGLSARDEWFQRGQDANDVAACGVGDMGVEPLLRARR
ncbi:MAG: hypothetical protein AAGB10_14980 [Pseudomonadota bacterium]